VSCRRDIKKRERGPGFGVQEHQRSGEGKSIGKVRCGFVRRPLGASSLNYGAGKQYVHIRADVDGAGGDSARGTLGYRAALEAEDL